MTFILAVLKNPDVQLRGQQEIDREIGPNRLPNLSDWDSLSYVRAICTEVLRYENKYHGACKSTVPLKLRKMGGDHALGFVIV